MTRVADAKVMTALKYATNCGCLIVQQGGVQRNMHLSTDDAIRRMERILIDCPRDVIGIYRVTQEFPEDVVYQYIKEDLKDAGIFH